MSLSTNVEPDVGRKGTNIEYAFHRQGPCEYDYESGHDLDFCDGKEWRDVKKEWALCLEAAEKDELHDDIVHIEKVWHCLKSDHLWIGYTTLFDFRLAANSFRVATNGEAVW